MTDLFAWAAAQTKHCCGECRNLDAKPLESGVRYCSGLCLWRFPHDPTCSSFSGRAA
jgi:hypothetical protein